MIVSVITHLPLPTLKFGIIWCCHSQVPHCVRWDHSSTHSGWKLDLAVFYAILWLQPLQWNLSTVSPALSMCSSSYLHAWTYYCPTMCQTTKFWPRHLVTRLSKVKQRLETLQLQGRKHDKGREGMSRCHWGCYLAQMMMVGICWDRGTMWMNQSDIYFSNQVT